MAEGIYREARTPDEPRPGAQAALSEAHRSVLVECFYHGRTAAQVAAAQGLPPGTVRSRIHYALRALRLVLEERGVDSS